MRARCTLHTLCGVQMRHHGHLKMDRKWRPAALQQQPRPAVLSLSTHIKHGHSWPSQQVCYFEGCGRGQDAWNRAQREQLAASAKKCKQRHAHTTPLTHRTGHTDTQSVPHTHTRTPLPAPVTTAVLPAKLNHGSVALTLMARMPTRRVAPATT
jgi:hypothetical protein